MRSARAAFDDGRWRHLPPAQNEKCLRRLAQLLEAHRELLMDLDVLEGGVIRSYSGFMVQLGIDIVDYYAGWPTKMHGAMPASSPDLVVQEVREPIGVVGVIMPWNGPSAVPLGVVPALACGNSRRAQAVGGNAADGSTARAAVHRGGHPARRGQCRARCRRGRRAQRLVEHPSVDAISFTGSVETGRRIQAAAARRLKRVALELGGKSPQLVFADADLDAAAATCAAAVWGHAGQVCIAGTRVLVQRLDPRRIRRSAWSSVTKDMRIGSGFDPRDAARPADLANATRSRQPLRRDRPRGRRTAGARRRASRQHAVTSTSRRSSPA